MPKKTTIHEVCGERFTTAGKEHGGMAILKVLDDGGMDLQGDKEGAGDLGQGATVSRFSGEEDPFGKGLIDGLKDLIAGEADELEMETS